MVDGEKYYLLESPDSAHHAGSKARDDICEILGSIDGWAPIRVHRVWGAAPSWKRALSARIVAADWIKVAHAVKAGDTLFVQYPLPYYPKVGKLALPFLKRIKSRGVKIIYLIHDLDSLRGMSQQIEQDYIACADVLIAHNDVMAAMLKGTYEKPVVSLDIFDYLIPGFKPNEETGHGIDVAGNLNHEKAGYLYGLASNYRNAHFNLYGPNFDESSEEASWYKGSFPPDDLPNYLTGAFGLIWDGDSAETCSGLYGEYLRINNPHKLSLYLACGKPVLIWDQAAEAAFVESQGVGKSVSSIEEGLDFVASISEESYRTMKSNCLALAKKLQSGYYTKQAVLAALGLCSSACETDGAQ